MVGAALIVALLAAAAYITVPLGAVPITLQVFVVILALLLLSPGWAAAAVALYLVMGAFGLPIFSGARGGLGVIVGPTGGYLAGFLVGAFAGAYVRITLEKRLDQNGIGQKIADFDLLIGATALCHELILVTNNTRHFARMQSLRLENWM